MQECIIDKNILDMPRKLLISILCVAFAVCTLSAQEQKVTWGARLSMDVSFPTADKNPYKVGSGFSAGAVANIILPKRFFFEPGLMFYYTAMSSRSLITFDDNYFYEGSAKIYGFRIPLAVGYNFDVADRWRMSVSTGPYLNVNISAQQNLDPNLSAPVPVPDKKISLFDHGWRHVDAGWHISLSTTFAESYYVGITGGVNFTPLASYGNHDKKIRIYRNTVAVTLGYNF